VIAEWEVGLTLVIIVGDEVFAIRSMRDTERMHANFEWSFRLARLFVPWARFPRNNFRTYCQNGAAFE
jgi:hypothetical protein